MIERQAITGRTLCSRTLSSDVALHAPSALGGLAWRSARAGGLAWRSAEASCAMGRERISERPGCASLAAASPLRHAPLAHLRCGSASASRHRPQAHRISVSAMPSERDGRLRHRDAAQAVSASYRARDRHGPAGPVRHGLHRAQAMPRAAWATAQAMPQADASWPCRSGRSVLSV